MAQTMLAKDALSGPSGEAYVTIQGRRYNFAQLINIQADMTKTKSTVAILGRVNKGNKPTGAEYSANATFYFNTSIFREMLYHYKETGEDIYFDVQISNQDAGSAAGRQTVILKDCNLNGGVIALIDANAETLEESIEFTFEDWEMPDKFNILSVMNS